jgi:hypothetical protein
MNRSTVVFHDEIVYQYNEVIHSTLVYLSTIVFHDERVHQK